MPRFFTDNIDGNRAFITGADAWHIGRSLRMRCGERLTLCSGGRDYSCRILTITDELITLEAESSAESAAEPTIRLTLYQAVPKQDKLDMIIQKSVELGAARIVPVLTSRCVSRPTVADFEKKRLRLKKIAAEAAKQSGRGRIPEIGGLLSFAEALNEMRKCETAIMCYEGGGCGMSSVDFTDECALLIGSEGGFSPQEAQLAAESGIRSVWLGNRILRCETAPLAAISIIMHLTGNM